MIFAPPFIWLVAGSVLCLGCGFIQYRFLYVLIVVLSCMNMYLRVEGQRQFDEREALYSGTVIGEEHYGDHVKLALLVDRAKINKTTIKCNIPAQLYVWQPDIYLGKYLTVKGKIRDSGYAHRMPLLVGQVQRHTEYGNVIGKFFHTIRMYIYQIIRTHLPAPQAEIAQGLILGGSGHLDPRVKDVFSRAGVLHILAVSGLHVGFVCAGVALLLMCLPLSPRVKFIVIMGAVIVYAGVTGFRPSVCRAGLMALLFGLALITERHVDALHIVNVAALVFLIADPQLLLNTSAQLSFAAVYGIVIVYPRVERILSHAITNKYLKYAVSLMMVSAAAQLFVAPLIVYYFGRLPTLAVLSNLIILPLTSIVVFFLFGMIGVGVGSGMCAGFVAQGVQFLLAVLAETVRMCASVPWSTVIVPTSPFILMIGYLLFSARFRKFALYLILALLSLHSLAALSRVYLIRSAPGQALITTPSNEKIYISTINTRLLNRRFLAAQGIDTLDFAIAAQDVYVIKNEFIPLPNPLQRERYLIGNLCVDCDKTPTIYCGAVRFRLCGKGDGEDNQVNYLLTDGQRSFRFNAPLYCSMIDRLCIDAKLTYFRLLILGSSYWGQVLT